LGELKATKTAFGSIELAFPSGKIPRGGRGEARTPPREKERSGKDAFTQGWGAARTRRGITANRVGGRVGPPTEKEVA